MKKLLLLLSIFSGFYNLFAVENSDKAINQAASLIREKKAECVVVKNGKIAAIERGRGVSPLLNLFEKSPQIMRDAAIVDKVIGRAAAFIVIKSQAVRVHAELISEDAIELLKQHNVAVSWSKKVPRILNRKRDGLCPLEDSVLNISDPDKALISMKKRIAELMKKSE